MMPKRCPECGSERLYLSGQSAETICRECGLIVEENGIDESPFLPASVTHHASMPSLATAGGAKVDGTIIKHSWLYSTKEKNLRDAKTKIEHIASMHNLPKYIIKEAKLIFKAVVEKELNRGRDNLSFVYASIYTACHMHSLPKTPLELTAFTTMTPKRMLRASRIMTQGLRISLQPSSPVDLLPRFASRLSLDQQTLTLAVEIVMKLQGTKVITGKNPSTVVASALYLASKMNGIRLTQREVANAVGVMEVTIRQRYKEMAEYL